MSLRMNDIQHNCTQRTVIECVNAQYRGFLNVILSAIMLNAVLLSVGAPNKKHLI
jgi:hypothetical protein